MGNLRTMRRGLSLLLILLLALMGQSLAQARGQTIVAGQVVLCSGYTVRVVEIGLDGKPVKELQICPDMALTVIAAIAAPATELQPWRQELALYSEQPIPLLARKGDVQPQARGPPARIV